MRFWQKIFISSLLLFFVLFDGGTYLIIKSTYQLSIKREIEGSTREQEIIFSSVSQEMKNIEGLNGALLKNEKVLQSIMEPLAGYYEELGVRIALYKEKEEVYSNIGTLDKTAFEKLDGDNRVVWNVKEDKSRTIYVISKSTDFPEFFFVYARDITTLDQNLESSTRTFCWISLGFMILLGSGNYLILRRLTKPINELNDTAKKIAEGAVSERVYIKSNDELGELAASFNKMADSVEQKIDRLNQASNEKQNFIDNMAHEMRTPLTSIMGYSEIIKNTRVGDQDKQLACNYIYTAARQLSNLQQELMELTYSENDKEEWEEIQVESLVRKLESLMNYSLKQRRLTLIVQSENLTIYGNESLLLSMLANLVENAARASKEGQAIEVRAYQKGTVRLEVKDYGCGIPEDEIEHIIEPFYRVDKARSRDNGGVGLGMSLVSKIAKLHNADLRITSQMEEGTKISIVFTTP